MASNAARGARAKARTKKWLQARGWQVADLELVRWIGTAGGRFPVKRDQFASDLLAVNESDVCFVQIKSGEAARGGTFPAARRAFEAFTFPPGVVRAIVAWPPRARAPRVVLVKPAKPAESAVYGEAKDSEEQIGITGKDGQWYASRSVEKRIAYQRKRPAYEGSAVTDTAGHGTGATRDTRSVR